MSDITAAAKARAEKVLAVQIRTSEFGITTKKERLDKLIESGSAKVEAALVPSVRWNRIKYNRMDNAQQAEYDRKREIKKTEYRLYTDVTKDSFYDITKIEYDYFNENNTNDENI